jgi:2-methylisocitrate lyase-like PEP mutase family enzyme
MNTLQKSKAEYFYKLHQQEDIFILPNAWDAVSAKIFEQTGAKAIGTTSAGMAIALGFPDGEKLPKALFLESCQRIISSVNIPVSVDIESGYGESLEEIKETVEQLICMGAAGINIEDNNPRMPDRLDTFEYQVAKIQVIREVIHQHDTNFFINARTDVYWSKTIILENRLEEALQRVLLYQNAGADGLFIPGIVDLNDIKKITRTINLPLNILANNILLSKEVLKQIGVKRISIGSGAFRAQVSFMKKIAVELIEKHRFDFLNNVIAYDDVNHFFDKQ